jgi:hypothetical protein
VDCRSEFVSAGEIKPHDAITALITQSPEFGNFWMTPRTHHNTPKRFQGVVTAQKWQFPGSGASIRWKGPLILVTPRTVVDWHRAGFRLYWRCLSRAPRAGGRKRVVSFARDIGARPVRTAFRSPWQNGIAERWGGSCRRDLLDHVIVMNERHLRRLMAEYIRYYHEDRTHLGLAKDTPASRPIALRPAVGSKIQSFPRLGGLHHRYAA